MIRKVTGYMIPSMSVNELMFSSKRLKQTEIILRGKNGRSVWCTMTLRGVQVPATIRVV